MSCWRVLSRTDGFATGTTEDSAARLSNTHRGSLARGRATRRQAYLLELQAGVWRQWLVGYEVGVGVAPWCGARRQRGGDAQPQQPALFRHRPSSGERPIGRRRRRRRHRPTAGGGALGEARRGSVASVTGAAHGRAPVLCRRLAYRIRHSRLELPPPHICAGGAHGRSVIRGRGHGRGYGHSVTRGRGHGRSIARGRGCGRGCGRSVTRGRWRGHSVARGHGRGRGRSIARWRGRGCGRGRSVAHGGRTWLGDRW